MTIKSEKPPSLSEYLDSVEGDTEAQEVELLGDDAYANRMLRELGSLRKQMKANSDVAAFERAKITDWERLVNDPLENRATYLYDNLTAYALNERTARDRKTISLPFGTISTTLEQPKWTVDPEAFLPWAKDSQWEADLVRTKLEPALAKIKALSVIDSDGNVVFTETGELIPGVTATTGTSYKPAVKTN